MLKIVGVHGVWNHQAGLDAEAASQRMSGWWRDAIGRGLGGDAADVEIEVAYYADLLHTKTSQGGDDPESLDEQAQADIVEWATLLGAPPISGLGRVTAPVRAAIAWVATKYGLDHAIAARFATAFFPEVGAYLTGPHREQVRARVAEAIHRVEPQILIAHSLGSAVAYETLWLHEHPPIDLLLTLGSPLAMPHLVYDRLAPHPGPRGKPPGVGRWINLADPGDIIAIPPGGLPRAFTGITSDLTNAIGAFDFHRSSPYLASPVTAGIVSTYL